MLRPASGLSPHADRLKTVRLPAPLPLDGGQVLEDVQIAWESWGQPDAGGTNTVLICHALTGDQFPASANPVTGRPPWWPRLIGPGKPVDTNRFHVVATNVLGGCMGSTGPASSMPGNGDAGQVWGVRFPVITIADMVRAQIMAMDALGIGTLHAVIGGSMGGMQVLEWARQAPGRVRLAIPIATAARHSAQNIGFYEVGRQAIMADPDWCGGDYAARGVVPRRGLAIARMAAHITYVSEAALKRKFDRGLQDRNAPTFGFDADFQIESYLRHQGTSFIDRFDANTYLYLTRAMDYFDLAAPVGGRLAEVFAGNPARFLTVAFTSDWHYAPPETRDIARALVAAGCDASHIEFPSDQGHDAFLLEEPAFEAAIAGFLASGEHPA
jgi:homoserine O-acetyltransferase